jgi:deoxyribonuclease V
MTTLGKPQRQHRIARLLQYGNGILHHRHAGIATHLGIAAELATIGIGKSLLCGSVDLDELDAGDARPVIHRGEPVACAIRSTPRHRPIFVSPGNRVDLPYAVDLTRRLMRDHRVPEPIFHAHAISRAACVGSRNGH